MQGLLEKQANLFRDWRSRWFVLSHEGLLSYWTELSPTAVESTMPKCTRHTRDITSVLSKQGYFAVEWKDGSHWNMRARDNVEHVKWVVILKQMTASTIENDVGRALVSTGTLDNSTRPAWAKVISPARAVAVVPQIQQNQLLHNKDGEQPQKKTATVCENIHKGVSHHQNAQICQPVDLGSSTRTITPQVNRLAEQYSCDSNASISSAALPLSCPGCSSQQLRIKPLCGVCKSSFFLILPEFAALDLSTCIKTGTVIQSVIGFCWH